MITLSRGEATTIQEASSAVLSSYEKLKRDKEHRRDVLEATLRALGIQKGARISMRGLMGKCVVADGRWSHTTNFTLYVHPYNKDGSVSKARRYAGTFNLLEGVPITLED